jgi:hypothetical protein
MTLTKERKAEVAWILLKKFVKNESIHLDPKKIKRNIGNKAKELGVTPEEIKAIFSDLLTELTQEILNELKK